ncbi:MAG: signal recognition particle protein [Deltaproteobacteria bacterium]|nr:signal recognition particle protein [Deltaproteobacteria bacterium]
MFESLTDKLGGVIKKLKGQGRVTEKNIEDAVREVKLALLEADVNYRVVKDFVAAITEKSLGEEVLRSLTPEQHFIKIVSDELTGLMGEEAVELDLKRTPPVPIMLVGLQGSGKTTTAGKLAGLLRKGKRRPLLVSTDIYRPAAIEQLKILGGQLKVDVYESKKEQSPVEMAVGAIRWAELSGLDTVIIDTAGRLHIDEELMNELVAIREAISPQEVLLVADAMTGQDAVNVAKSFDESVRLTGVILTKLDGDARGGAAISIRAVTGCPIKFVGVGEKLGDLELFHPSRMASRILGMGDVLSLIEKATEVVDEKKALELEKKIRKSQFNLEDFRDQMIKLQQMGPLEDIMGMIPGLGSKVREMGQGGIDEREIRKNVAIINSMTRPERENYRMINGSRRKRIAAGSGTTAQDVNRLLKNFQAMESMMKKMTKKGMKSLKRGGFPFM